MSDEAYTQVAPDSTGDRIRTNEIELLQEDGSRVTVSIQVISISDAEGNIIGVPSAPLEVSSKKICSLLEELLEEIRQLRIK